MREMVDAYEEVVGKPPNQLQNDSLPKPSGASLRRVSQARRSDSLPKKAPGYTFLEGSWDEIVERVVPLPTGGEEQTNLSVQWKDRPEQTTHSVDVLRVRCPQKLIDYLLNPV